MTTDLDAAYAAACRRATDTAYRFAVALEESYAPADAPRNKDSIRELQRTELTLVRLAQYLGISEPRR
jgi:hypothetical protein